METIFEYAIFENVLLCVQAHVQAQAHTYRHMHTGTCIQAWSSLYMERKAAALDG